MRSFLVGALALVALEVIVSSSNGANAVGGVFGFVGDAARRLISPEVPAIGRVGAAPADAPNVKPLRPGTPARGAAPGSADVTPITQTTPVLAPWWATQGVNA